jgi:hypothetical protein
MRVVMIGALWAVVIGVICAWWTVATGWDEAGI